MFKKHKGKIILGLIAVAIVILLAVSGGNSSQVKSNSPSQWKSAGVNCLPPNPSLAFHNHADLTIKINGKTQQIPKGIGVSNSCMAEIHTHDPDNVVHAESTNPDKQLTLSQFFKVWGKKLDKPGLNIATSTVDGQSIKNPGQIVLRDGIDIKLTYVSSTSQDNSTSTQ